MRSAVNQTGYVVERFDGQAVGWTAITEPGTRALAQQQLDNLARTPGADYRIYPSLKETHEPV